MNTRLSRLASRQLLLCVLLSIGVAGCNSSSDDAELPLEDAETPVPIPTEPGTTPSESPDENQTDTPPGDNPDEPVDESPAEPDLGMLIPEVEEGSDLDRLIRGVTRQVARTLLDLNRQISEGIELTPLQESCLGAYDPAIGEQLLAIDCGEQSLATGDINIHVGRVAFYDTADCQASVFAGDADNCKLAQATVSIPADWEVVEGQRRPQLVYAGSEIRYAIEGTLLQLENEENALGGFFKCDIDLASGSTAAPLTGQSCQSIVASVADRLDVLLPQ